MKKIVSMIMVIIMAMTISVTAFAAEESSENNKLQDRLIDSDDCISIEKINGSIETRGTAPEVSSVEVVDYGFLKAEVYPQRAGHFAVIVKVMGYGYTYAYFDGKSIGLPLESEGILDANNVAVGWYYLYDCGPLTVGDHEFKITVSSYQTATHQKTAGLQFTYNPE